MEIPFKTYALRPAAKIESARSRLRKDETQQEVQRVKDIQHRVGGRHRIDKQKDSSGGQTGWKERLAEYL